MDLSFRTRYWDDLPAKQAFKDFILHIHGLDFTSWDAAGYWDDDYIPFTYFAGGQVVASMCIYTMPAIVNGEPCKVAQVSGVGTLPEYRRMGLNRKLHEIALDWALGEHKFAFLFADEEAIPFYAKCGFRPIKDYAPLAVLPAAAPKEGLRKIDLRDAAETRALYGLASHRAPVSHVFSNMNPKLVMFHALYSLREHAYRIDDLDAVIFMKRDGNRTIVYDLLARELPAFEQLHPYLATGTAQEFEFRFHADRLGIVPAGFKELQGNDTHVMGEPDLGAHFVFPFTAHA
ncbi:MAG TPA: GNAT family N-acetyltransferase [Paucimonas sp.]|nr:GNAT family N-acetyltransferase [Paucimonas sp.]